MISSARRLAGPGVGANSSAPEFIELFRKYRPAITGVTFWGIADDNTWLSEFSSGRKDFPLLFDINHDPKPAYDAVVDF
ncbi:hypothetical protein BE21_30970 [Sorangium cellulosum]|uniref:GH10 domain-containing protein n=1 Tax=Sorangium cellulosum TaxID=56 RepID=A0A150TQY9_SORCE|nr:hypothetical protein BE21_30970 [Sorangium cellulosum]